ncbi:MAG: inositol 2-dehydrogenase, partial [Pseudomonadota bacterium]
SVADQSQKAAAEFASHFDCTVATVHQIATAQAIDAVMICTPTDTHDALIRLYARHEKAIFCEKPIDLDPNRTRDCLIEIAQHKTRLMVGFNRRFDPHFASLRHAIHEGRIGRPEMAILTSRDPQAPPLDYIRHSGGIFKDMMIHDFDMAMFLMNERPVKIQASGSVLTDPAIGQLGDYDSAAAILTMESGAQVMISNSRRSCYGYDQRIEVHGSHGMIRAENQRPINIELANETGFTKPPLHDFFMTRYQDAYRQEVSHFITCIQQNTAMTPSGEDGLYALELATAAASSAASGHAILL